MIPEALLQDLREIKGFDESAFIQTHLEPSPVSIRINREKYLIDHSTLKQVPWCDTGFYLDERPSFTLDPKFHGGAYYVQEASSMAIAQICREYLKDEPIKALDLCAAPGGKSTLLSAYIPDKSLLVCNEVIKTRVKILEENITKWSNEYAVITNNDPQDFEQLPEFFDLILVDAPCSGSGLFRKDSKAIEEWSIDAVTLCYGRQQRILNSAIKALKPGGILIYSTCSYSPQENEDVVDWLIAEQNMGSLTIKFEDEWGITEVTTKKAGAGYRFWPHTLKGEGFFLAVFQKEKGAESNPYIKESPKWTVIKNNAFEKSQSFIKPELEYCYLKLNDYYVAFPYNFQETLGQLASKLYIKKAGIKLGRIMGKDFVPDHELALSKLLPADTPSVNMDKEEAINYLRKQNNYIETDFIGWNIIRCESVALGWIKAMKGRTNNYYPSEWRILK